MKKALISCALAFSCITHAAYGMDVNTIALRAATDPVLLSHRTEAFLSNREQSDSPQQETMVVCYPLPLRVYKNIPLGGISLVALATGTIGIVYTGLQPAPIFSDLNILTLIGSVSSFSLGGFFGILTLKDIFTREVPLEDETDIENP